MTKITYPTDSGFVFDAIVYAANTKTINNANNGQRIELVNALGKLKRVAEKVDGTGATTKVDYAYDGFGNLTSTVDQVGNAIAITYDKLGRKKTLNDPDLGNWSYNVDALGRVYSQTDARSKVSTFNYDKRLSITATVRAVASGCTGPMYVKSRQDHLKPRRHWS